MTIVRRPSPFGELLSLRQAMDRLFEDSFVSPRSWSSSGSESVGLPLDIFTTADEVIVEAALPGVKPDAVEMTITGDTLTISGKTSSERTREEGSMLVSEIRRGSFSRAIALPQGLQADKAAASFEDGVLTLRIPKAETVKPRQIKISPSGGARQRVIEAAPQADGQR